MPYPVKYFASDMQGAPALSGTAGSLIAVLDACLFNGFGTLTIDSLAVASAVATVTKSAGHAYLAGSVIEVAGATPSGLNGEKRVLSVTATTLTFDATGIGDGTASGTITVKIPAVGSWEKAFSGTNLAAYRSLHAAATGRFLRVNEASVTTDLTRVAQVRGYEAMTGISTGTGPFPTTAQEAGNGLRWVKSDADDIAAREWVLIADGRTIYLWIQPSPSLNAGRSWHSFGDLANFKSPDTYAVLLGGGRAANVGDHYAYQTWYDRVGNTNGTAYLPRSYAGTGTSVPATMEQAAFGAGGYIGQGTLAMPCPVDSRIWVAPAIVGQGASLAAYPRGRLRGVYEYLHATAVSHSWRQIVPDMEGLPALMMAMPGHGGIAGVYNDVMVDLSGDTW